MANQNLKTYLKNLGAAFRGVTLEGYNLSNGSIDYRYQTDADGDSSAVVCSISWLVKNVAEPKLKHYDADGNEVKDSPVVKAFYNPGKTNLTGRRLLKAAVWGYATDGNAYCRIIRDGTGQPADLIYYNPNQVAPVASENGLLAGYRLAGKTDVLPVEDFVHFADGEDESRPLRGISALRRITRIVAGDREADRYQEAILRNPAILGLVFLPDEDPGPENAAYMTDQLNARFGGGGRGGTMVASVRGKFERPGLNPEQLALSSLRRDQEARISGAVGIPSAVSQLTVGQDSTYANYSEAVGVAYSVLRGIWAEWAESLTLQFLYRFGETREVGGKSIFAPTYEGHYLEFDTSTVEAMADSRRLESDRVTADWQANLIDRAEANRRKGYPVSDADKGVYFSATNNNLTADQLRTRERLRANRKAYQAIEDESESLN